MEPNGVFFSAFLPPKGTIVQVCSKFNVRPSARLFVCPSVRGVTLFLKITFWDLLNPYLVPESAFVLVSFWVISAQRIWVTSAQYLAGLSHVLDKLTADLREPPSPCGCNLVIFEHHTLRSDLIRQKQSERQRVMRNSSDCLSETREYDFHVRLAHKNFVGTDNKSRAFLQQTLCKRDIQYTNQCLLETNLNLTLPCVCNLFIKCWG